MIIYNLLITLILFVLFLIFLWNLYTIRKKRFDNIPDDNLPFVSVLIPARNEEFNIKNVLLSLLKQNYPRYEVIVLNDNSEDKTGEIISELKKNYAYLKIINGKPLEKGWTGKCFACKQLSDGSNGDYILFTDSDTSHSPSSLRNAVTIALCKNSDMLTLIPQFTMVTFSEKLIMPMLLFTLMMLLPLYFVDKKGFIKFSAGIGPFMLFKRSAYEKIGGHESVKSALVEDIWLARKIKENNLKLNIEDGTEMLSVRMYRGFKEIWEGFSKNIFAGFDFSSVMLFIVNSLYFLLFFIPFLLFCINLSWYKSINELVFLTGIQVLFLYFARFLMSLKFRLGTLSAILHPLGALMVPVIAVNSWRWIKFGKGAKWKGRVYKK